MGKLKPFAEVLLGQLGSRLVVNINSADRIGLHLTHTGAIVGMEFSF